MRQTLRIGPLVAGVAGVGGLAVVALGGMRLRDDMRTDEIWDILAQVRAAREPASLDALPAAVRRYFRHAIRESAPPASGVIMRQDGEMKPGGAWMPFTAEEIVTPGEGLVWKARAGRGLGTLIGADWYYRRQWRMRFRALGLIPVVSSSDPSLLKSAAARLVLESIWCPPGLLPGRGIAWEEIDEERALARVTQDGLPVTLMIATDAAGALREVTAVRFNENPSRGPVGETLFGMRCDAEETFDGYTIPTRLHGGWFYGTEDFEETFRVTVHAARFF